MSITLRDALPFLAGIVLAILVGMFASALRLDRGRAFYPTVMIVIATFYLLFAVMGGSPRALVYESIFALAFIGAALAGFKKSLWIVVAALAAHGVFDAVHSRLIDDPGVPVWWASFCLAYDAAAASYLAYLLLRDPA